MRNELRSRDVLHTSVELFTVCIWKSIIIRKPMIESIEILCNRCDYKFVFHNNRSVSVRESEREREKNHTQKPLKTYIKVIAKYSIHPVTMKISIISIYIEKERMKEIKKSKSLHSNHLSITSLKSLIFMPLTMSRPVTIKKYMISPKHNKLTEFILSWWLSVIK